MTKPTFYRFAAPALLVIAALGMLRCSPAKEGSRASEGASGQPAGQFAGGEKQAATGAAPAPKPKSKLVLENPRLAEGNVLRFPLEFTGGPGESVGTIHAQVSIPKGPWKFVKAEAPFKSHLKVVAKPENAKPEGGNGEAATGQGLIDLTISGAGDGIDDGLAGYLDFLGPQEESARTELPVARIVKTVPIQTKAQTSQPGSGAAGPSSSSPSEEPSDPSTAVPVNPGMGCFFFSH